MRLAAATALIAALAVPSTAAAAPAGPVARDVVYARHGGTEQRMDVHQPATRPASGAPAIVWVHGGGFHSGSRARLEPYARWFAAHGHVAANIDYRLRPRDEVRAIGYANASGQAQADALAAVRYVRRHAAALGVNPRRIAIAGVSAGAITALNVAARGTGHARVHAAAAIAGFGPQTDVDAADPPVLLLHGTADRAVPFRLAQDTCAATRAAGARCDLVPFPGVGHRLAAERFADVAPRILRWIGRQPARRRAAGVAPPQLRAPNGSLQLSAR